MFRRRREHRWTDRLREFVWPRMGWRRTTTYLLRRMARLPGTTQSIAAGFAFGAAVSFTPLVGLHLVFAALLSWIVRVNIVASAVGTLIGNPWSFPIIWLWIYNLGRWMGVGVGAHNPDTLNFPQLFGRMLSSLLKFDLLYLKDSAWPVFGPMLIGSIPTAIVAWIITYFVMKQVVGVFRTSKLRRRNRSNAAQSEEGAIQ